jgi:AcrR family transcriptional regulator
MANVIGLRQGESWVCGDKAYEYANDQAMVTRIRLAAPPAPNPADTRETEVRKRPRREQQRAIETRKAIFDAALAEFAAKGFDAANTRAIAERAGLQPALVAYHFKTKDVLWRSVAEHFLAEIREAWDQRAPVDSSLSAKEKVREEFRALFWMMMNHQHFYQFMLRENTPESPRLPWLAETILAPMVGRVLPQIRLAQEAGEFPQIEPILFHYMTIGIASALPALGREILLITGISVNDPGVAESYLQLVDSIVFGADSDDASDPDVSDRLKLNDPGAAPNALAVSAVDRTYVEELEADNARLKRLLIDALLAKERQNEVRNRGGAAAASPRRALQRGLSRSAAVDPLD